MNKFLYGLSCFFVLLMEQKQLSAQMALAGVCSAIAPDEVIDTMRRIGNALPACLKETSEGGLATTPSAQKVREKMDGEQ